MNEKALENHKNIDYDIPFLVKYVDQHPHSRITDIQGVKNNETLVEGYIDFDDEGKIRRVSIKPLDSRGTLVQQPREKQEKISEAIRTVIKEKLNKT
jgi:hypothetical protein